MQFIARRASDRVLPLCQTLSIRVRLLMLFQHFNGDKDILSLRGLVLLETFISFLFANRIRILLRCTIEFEVGSQLVNINSFRISHWPLD